MIGLALFAGFFAGLAFAVALCLLLPRLPRLNAQTEEPSVRRDSKELERLQRQLDEINRYDGNKAVK
ncbi:MAG: hypothetical protein DBY36_07765 [Clostridiales bacterium]|nr:MAG: hypothetical protein DBY36_07765 [Clostridiales bacterium]